MRTIRSQKADSLPAELKKLHDEAWDDKFPLDIDEAMDYIKKTYGGYHQTAGAYPFDIQVHKMKDKIRLTIVTYKTRKVPYNPPRPNINISPNTLGGIGGMEYYG